MTLLYPPSSTRPSAARVPCVKRAMATVALLQVPTRKQQTPPAQAGSYQLGVVRGSRRGRRTLCIHPLRTGTGVCNSAPYGIRAAVSSPLAPAGPSPTGHHLEGLG